MIDPRAVINAVAVSTGVSAERIRGPFRHRVYSHPRNAAVLAMRWGGLSLHAIGRELGGRDHSTIIGAAQRAAADLDQLAMAADACVRCELEWGMR